LTVGYHLHAEIEYRVSSDQAALAKEQLSGDEEIEVLPFVDDQPPTETTDFPDEFILEATSRLASRLLRIFFGRITITMTEPPPLARRLGTADMNTMCEVKVVIRGSQSCIKRLEKLTISVKASIRTKTFLSSTKVSCSPTQSHLPSDKSLHLVNEFCRLKPMKFKALNWTTHGPVEITQHSTFLLPIIVSQNLSPTYCGSLSARSYSLLVNMTVHGMHSEGLRLEVPVQVANPSRRQTNQDNTEDDLLFPGSPGVDVSDI